MSPNNVKQADVISGATVLLNDNGTAPGQWISGKSDGKEKIVILVPGPPHELKAMFEGAVLERLRARLPKQFIVSRVLKITGMGESRDARSRAHLQTLQDVNTTILASPGEIG
jgi:nicotinamide-nucleotide amidase